MIRHVSMATWTQADIDILKTAIRTGVLSVTFTGPPQRQTTYQSLDAMRRLLAEMTTSVAGGGTPYRLAASRKGL